MKKKGKNNLTKQNPYKPKAEKDAKKINPFEVHINKEKFSVVGQKSKDDRGLPGVSRTKANRTREKTLLLEYRERNKSNVFKDKRIGENNSFMDPEKKIMLRMAAEKKQQMSRKSIFNLNDDEELTHGGQALSEANMKDAISDDDEEDDFLDAKFVQKQHFGGGGFLTKSKTGGETGGTNEKDGKTRKEWIEQIIAESKLKKFESKKEKAEQEDAVTKINSQYQNFLSLMNGKVLTDDDKDKSKKECEFRDYDLLVRTLMVERCRKAPATDKLMSNEEMAKLEKERLEQREQDRIQRMNGDLEGKTLRGFSADSLDDGVTPVSNSGKSTMGVAYRDGKLMLDLEGDSSFPLKKKDEESNENDNDEASDDSAIEDDNEDAIENVNKDESSDDEESDQFSDILDTDSDDGNLELKEEILNMNEEFSDIELSDVDEEIEDDDDENDNDVAEEHEENEDEDCKGVDEEESDDDNCKSDDDNSEQMVDEEDCETSDLKQESPPASFKPSTKKNGTIVLDKKKNKVKFLDRERIMEEAKKEIPYTFEVPSEYEQFWNLFEGRSSKDWVTILDRMIACNHPKLGGTTQGKTTTIFNYLLQTLHLICSQEPDVITDDSHPLSYVDTVIPFLYNLVQLLPSASAQSLVQVIDEKHKDFSKDKSKKYPFVDTFIFLKISGLLYPTSDAYHQVTTRVMAFLLQILSETKVKNRRDLTGLAFTASLLCECISKSGRFVSELSNSLKGLLYVSIPAADSKYKLPLTMPFKRLGPLAELLVLEKKCKGLPDEGFTLSSLNDDSQHLDDKFKVQIFNHALTLLTKLTKVWCRLPSVQDIFKPVCDLLEAVPHKKYPAKTLELITELKKAIERLPQKRKALLKQEGRPAYLKMIEPEVEKIYEGARHRSNVPKSKLERQKLLHKVNRERKGAKRELKRDAEFLAREKLSDELKSDAERKRKVNLIMGGLATQEHEFKKFKKS